MITVANRTETAARVQHAFKKRRIHIDELCESERILHIDSKVLAEAKAKDELVASTVLTKKVKRPPKKEQLQPRRKLTKAEQAERPVRWWIPWTK